MEDVTEPTGSPDRDRAIGVRSGSRRGIPDPFGEFEGAFDRLFGGGLGWPAGLAPGARSAMNVQETDRGYVLTAELPGVSSDDVEITINGNLLSIRAERRPSSEGSEIGYERPYRLFQQTASLPSNVDASSVEAHCEDGLLEVFIPKAELGGGKRVEVQSGKGGLFKRFLDATKPSPDAEPTSQESSEPRTH